MRHESDVARPMEETVAAAQSLFAVNRFEDGASMLRSAIASEPDDPRPRILLAAGLIDRRRLREGLREAEGALRVAPDSETSHRLRAYALLELKRYRPALAAINESLRLDPQSPDSYLVLSEIQMATRQFEDAERSAHRAAKLKPGEPQVNDLLGRVALTKKDAPAAEKYFRLALASEPDRWQTLNNLSVALLQQGRAAEAADVFQAAVRLQPQNPFLRRGLANLTSNEAIVGAVIFTIGVANLQTRFSFGLPGPVRAVITGAIVLGCIALVVKRLSSHSQFVGRLAAPTLAVAKIERRAERHRHDRRAAFTTGIAVAIWILGGVLSVVIGLGWPLLLAFPIGVVWLFVGHVVWDRMVIPRLEDADQSGT